MGVLQVSIPLRVCAQHVSPYQSTCLRLVRIFPLSVVVICFDVQRENIGLDFENVAVAF